MLNLSTVTLQSIFRRAAIQPVPNLCCCVRWFRPRCRTLCLPLFSFMTFHLSHFSRLWVPLNASLVLQCVSCFLHLVSSMRLLRVPFLAPIGLLIKVLDILPQFWLKEHTRNWLPAVLHTIEYNPSSPTVRQFFPRTLCPCSWFTSPQLWGHCGRIGQKPSWNQGKWSLPFSPYPQSFIAGGSQVGQTQFSFGNSVQIVSNHLVPFMHQGMAATSCFLSCPILHPPSAKNEALETTVASFQPPRQWF